jgi:hypothetical protein
MQKSLSRNILRKISHKIMNMLVLTNTQRERYAEINELRFTTYCCEIAKRWRINY